MKKTLYVGNLPYSVDESKLQKHFASYGSSNARIIEARGFGFVDIDGDQMQAAIGAMNNSDMDGRTITVNEARPKEERSSNGGGSSRSYSNTRSRY